MGEVINLRHARKAKARIVKARQAEENRVRYGQTKEERERNASREEKQKAIVEGAFRETRGDNETM